MSSFEWTTIAPPLPSPPDAMLNDPIVNATIKAAPHLFKIVTPINVDRLAQLSATHPNRPFVESVLEGLTNGFWPFASMPSHYPTTWDASMDSTMFSEDELVFLRAQRDTELLRDRYSEAFDELMPGMYVMPVFPVPKDNGKALRLVTDHSRMPFPLNGMIDKERMGAAPLDGLKLVGFDLLEAKEEFDWEDVVIWKSDVSEAYRLCPMHRRWQVLQIEKIDGRYHVNRCNVFGGIASQYIFISVMALVNWIAVHVRNIRLIKAFSDDNFGPALASDLKVYNPTGALMPRPQVELLELWDYLGIPHKPSKQVWGAPLVVIGIEIDPNELSFRFSKEAKDALIAELEKWIADAARLKGNGSRLRNWQRLAGWLNWAFNVYPLLRPCLSSIYAKIAGKTKAHAKIRSNDAIRFELSWALNHLRSASGVYMLSSIHWRPDEASLTIFCDASLEGMGFYVESIRTAFYCPTVTTPHGDFIFYHEALCVLAALIWANDAEALPQRLVIYTDNSNAVDIFSSLSASPKLNPILLATSDLLLEFSHDLKVLFIPGSQNEIADAISRRQFERAKSLVPGIKFSTFKPPQLPMGPVSC